MPSLFSIAKQLILLNFQFVEKFKLLACRGQWHRMTFEHGRGGDH